MKLQCKVHRAKPLWGPGVNEAVLEIVSDLPALDGPDWMETARGLYDGDATAIEDLLFKALPGGVYDRLLVKLMERKASMFRVAHDKVSDGAR